MISKHTIPLLALLALTACGGNARRTSSAARTPQSQTAAQADAVRGTYTGTLPAADCPGIEVTLTLGPDATYELRRHYIDRDATFEEKGGYTVLNDQLTLKPADGATPTRYRVEGDRLRMLDGDGKAVSGPLADHYVLTRKNR